jgi:hypothetical protein
LLQPPIMLRLSEQVIGTHMLLHASVHVRLLLLDRVANCLWAVRATDVKLYNETIATTMPPAVKMAPMAPPSNADADGWTLSKRARRIQIA